MSDCTKRQLHSGTIQKFRQEESATECETKFEDETKTQYSPSKKRMVAPGNCCYFIPLREGSLVIASINIIYGFVFAVYGYYSLILAHSERWLPRSNDDVMAKLTGIVFILVAFMIVLFSSVLIAGIYLKRSGLVFPFVTVGTMMSICAAVLCVTTGIAIDADKKQDDTIAHITYISTAVGFIIQCYFIRIVHKLYKAMRLKLIV